MMYSVNLIRKNSAFTESLSHYIPKLPNLWMWNIRIYRSFISYCLSIGAQHVAYIIYYFTISQVPVNRRNNRNKWPIMGDSYVHLNWTDAYSALSINLKTCYRSILKECGRLLVFFDIYSFSADYKAHKNLTVGPGRVEIARNFYHIHWEKFVSLCSLVTNHASYIIVVKCK